MEALKKAWAGEQRLAVAFWVFFVIPQILIALSWQLIYTRQSGESSGLTFAYVLWGMLTAGVSIVTLIIVWRCAKNVHAEAKYWTDLVRVLVIFAIFPLVLGLLVSTYSVYDSRQNVLAKAQLEGVVHESMDAQYARDQKLRDQKRKSAAQSSAPGKDWGDTVQDYQKGIEERRKKWGN